MNTRLIITADTFLKTLPDPISTFKQEDSPNQVVLLKQGTTLEISDYSFIQGNIPWIRADDYFFVRLVRPPVLTNHQNLCWFVRASHVEIQETTLQNDCGQDLAEPVVTVEKFKRAEEKRLELTNPLDSFSSLAVSPPVTANGQYYPFGRLIFNSGSFDVNPLDSAQTISELRRFFYAQKIQAPFGLYTDWLVRDRVDEIISFLPADNDKGFKVLVASPLTANILLKRLSDRGFPALMMFQGMQRADYRSTPGARQNAAISIAELLQDKSFWDANQRYQSYMHENILILKKELGLSIGHFVNIPALFHSPFKNGRTAPYFPNLVKHHLLSDGSLLVSKPQGPIVNGKCAFETALEQAISDRTVHFAKVECHHDKQSGKISLWS